MPASALAQAVEFDGKPVATLTPPQGEVGQKHAQILAAAGIQARVAYVPDLGKVPEQKPPPPRDYSQSGVVSNQGLGTVLLVMAVFLGLLFAWVKFSGSALLAPNIDQGPRKPVVVPTGWAQSQSDLVGSDILAQIAAMADRRAALVRLLRLCLLQAAESAGIGFKRSDTERMAFGRFAAGQAGRPYLQRLLLASELAHYGGQEVDEAGFQDLIQGARMVLPRQAGAHV